MLVLRRWLGKHPTHVFSFRGKPIVQVSTKAWYEALERAEIHDFRWHDLRHTWASWHVQNGTPLFALQELGGWKALRWCGATRTYRPNISPRTRIAYALCGLWKSLPTARLRHSRKRKRARIRCKPLSNLARPAGFEPTTPWFVAKYSIQLSYGRKGAEFITGPDSSVAMHRCV